MDAKLIPPRSPELQERWRKFAEQQNLKAIKARQAKALKRADAVIAKDRAAAQRQLNAKLAKIPR